MKFFQKMTMAGSALILSLLPFTVVYPLRVEGRSMEPALHSHQMVLVLRRWAAGNPSRGEVWLINTPDGPSIKRVIALPGERLFQINGQISVENNPVIEKWITIPDTGDSGPWQTDRAFFLLGDNRPLSRDSRAWGPLAKEAFAGRIIFEF